MNRSPWLTQLKKQRPEVVLADHHTTDIAVIGGGIAGVSTAYFLLTRTKHKVALFEATRIAHGATGHNAGQIVSYFERSFHDLVKEFGLAMTAQAQAGIESAWGLLDEMRSMLQPQTPVNLFVGYAGMSDVPAILSHLENNSLRKKAGLLTERMRIANMPSILEQIPAKYAGYYSVIPHDDVLALLETQDRSFIAVLSAQKGVTNSALFTEELAGALIAKFPGRFQLYERSPIETVALHHNAVQLESKGKHVTCHSVVLCTNGFEQFTITDGHGNEIDRRFHEEVSGTIGYMAGYLEPINKPPTAISYLPKGSTNALDPYFYLTRRPYELDKGETHNLICIGGPEELLGDKRTYQREMPFPESALADIQRFLQERDKEPHAAVRDAKHFAFTWHGLMGYTKNGIRMIGRDPCHERLLYNLGCNGIGILPSIYGAKKIADIVRGERQLPSLFDPYHGTCEMPEHTKTA